MSDKKHTEATTAAIYGKQLDSIHCLLIPILGEHLLLPNAAVAEVVPYADHEKVDGAPEWFLGRMLWRDRHIPLIAFEAVTGGDLPPLQKQSRIAVLNTLNANTDLPYIGILTQGIPHLQVVQEPHMMRDEQPADPRASVADYVLLNGESAVVPDLDALEDRLMRLHEES